MKKIIPVTIFVLIALFSLAQSSPNTPGITIKDCFNRFCQSPTSKPYDYWKQITRKSDFGKTPLLKTSVSVSKKINDSTSLFTYRTMHKGHSGYEKNGVSKSVTTQSADKSTTIAIGTVRKGGRFVNSRKTETFTFPGSRTNISYLWNGDSWMPTEKTVDADSSNGLIRSNIRYMYRNGQWIPEKKREEESNPQANTSAMWYYDFDTLAQQWKLRYFWRKTFDENCMIKHDTSFSNSYDGSIQRTFTEVIETDTGTISTLFETRSDKDSVRYFRHRSIKGIWKEDTSYTYTMDYLYPDSIKGFVLQNLHLRKSDTAQKTSEDIIYSRDTRTNEWIPSSKSYRYTDSSGITRAVFYNYDTKTKRWSIYGRNEQKDRPGFMPEYFRNTMYNYAMKRWVCNSYIRNVVR